MQSTQKVYRCARCEAVHTTVVDYLEHRKTCVPSTNREIEAQKVLGLYMSEEEREYHRKVWEKDQASLKDFLNGKF